MLANKDKKVYTIDGKQMQIKELRDLIINVVGHERITSTEIAKRIKADYIYIRSTISSMVAYRYLNSSGSKSQTLYHNNHPCALQDIYHPMPNFAGQIKGSFIHDESHDKHNVRAKSKWTNSTNSSSLYSMFALEE